MKLNLSVLKKYLLEILYKDVYFLARFGFLIYYITSTTFRLCFQYNFSYNSTFTVLLFFDYLADTFYFVDFLVSLALKTKNNKTVQATNEEDLEVEPIERLQRSYSMASMLRRHSSSINLVRPTETSTKYSYTSIARWSFEIFSAIPLEGIACALGYRYYMYFRISKILRLAFWNKYWDDVQQSVLKYYGFVASDAGARLYLFCIIQVVFIHVFACFYFIVGLKTLNNGQLDRNWLLHDGNAKVVDGIGVLTQTLNHIYLRSFYWSAQTLETVGHGDMVGWNFAETILCILLFFTALVVIQFSIANVVIYISSVDEARARFVQQTVLFNRYAIFRNLPRDLVERVHAYYENQWKSLEGVEEHELVEELPSFIQSSILQHTVRDALKNLPVFKRFSSSLLTALAQDVQVFLYSPGDVIVSHGSLAKGMYIVVRGTVVNYGDIAGNGDLSISQALRAGDVVSEAALFNNYYHLSTLHAKSFCELMYLSGSRFRYTCKMHLSDEQYEQDVGSKIHNDNSPLPPPKVKKEKSNRSMNSAVTGSEDDDSVYEEMTEFPFHKHRRVKGKHRTIFGHQTIRVQEEYSPLDRFFRPGCLFRNIWDCFVFVALLYYLFVSPLLLSESFASPFVEKHIGMLIISYVCDAIMAVNLLFNVFFFGFIKDGLVVNGRNEICANFCKKKNIYLESFFIIPLDLIAYGFNVNCIPVIRLLKLYHIRIIRAQAAKVEKALQFKSTSGTFQASRLSYLFCCLYIFIHYLGCIYILIARCSTHVFDYKTNWIRYGEIDPLYSFDYSRLSGTVVYFRAVYWALSTTSSIGFYDILPRNPVEVLGASLLMIIGCQIFIGMLGGIATVIRDLNKSKRAFQKNVINMQELLKIKEISGELTNKILYFYDYTWERCRGVDETKLLTTLPVPLRQAIVYHVIGHMVENIPIFSDCIEPFLQSLVGCLVPRLFLDGDSIVIAGEYGKEMFILESGVVLVTNSDKSVVFATLESGAYLGESSLLKITQRTASAFAVGYCNTYVLSNLDFNNIVSAYPQEGKEVLDKIRKVLEDKNRKNMTKVRHSNESRQTNSSSDNGHQENPSIENSAEERPAPTPTPHPFFQASSQFFSNSKWRHPDSKERKLWETLLLFIIVYNLIMVPLRFVIKFSPHLFAVDFTFDIMLWIDIYLLSTKFYVLSEGSLKTREEDIRKVFWEELPVDNLIGILPVDLLVVCFIHSKYDLAYILSLLRLIKVFLIPKIFKCMKSVDEIFERIRIPYVVTRVCRLLSTIVLVGHWAACGFYLFSKANYGNPCDQSQYEFNCKFRDTWVESQIMTNKLPLNGGTDWMRYLRALNWAIPTLTMEVIDDIFATNENEMLYSLVVMFFGLSINAAVIGSLISLVTDVSNDETDIVIVQTLLEERNVTPHLRNKVITYLRFLKSDYGSVVTSQDEALKQLPYSLQVEIASRTKMNLLKACPFFSFCNDEIRKNLCMSLKLCVFCIGDDILKCGDLGNEMFFLEKGSVEVIGRDGSVLTTLNDGAYFGESGLVFSTIRMATIRATTLCITYMLTKEVLDYELRACNFDVTATLNTLVQIYESNTRINRAVTQNLVLIKNPHSKVSYLVGSMEEEEDKANFLQALKAPHSTFRICWDVIGLIFLLYLTVSIPFEIAFLEDVYQKYMGLIAFDVFVDVYFIVDIYLRSRYFPFVKPDGTLVTDKSKIWEKYLSEEFWYDVFASFPLELLIIIIPRRGLLPNITIFVFRALHYLRARNLPRQVAIVESHAHENGITLHKPFVMCLKAILLYLITCHVISCCYFMIHRYAELHEEMTYVIADGLATYNPESRTHSICSVKTKMCYFRSIYFVLSTFTSVGYGDVAPHRNIEFVYEIFVVALVGALLNSTVCGAFGNYLSSLDVTNGILYRKKLNDINKYLDHRNLKERFHKSIKAHFEYLWTQEKQIGGDKASFLNKLPEPLAHEVAFELHKQVIQTIPIFDTFQHFADRFAYALKPQFATSGTLLYSLGDPGEEIYFVISGKMKVSFPLNVKMTKARYVLKNKLSKTATGGYFTSGDHFGEFCILASKMLRLENMQCISNCEMYALNREALWKVLRCMERHNQKKFITLILTQLNGKVHSHIPSTSGCESPAGEENDEIIVTNSINNLYSTASKVLDAIGLHAVEQGFIEKGALKAPDFIVTSKLSSKVSVEFSTVNDEEQTPWLSALKAFEGLRRKRSPSIIPSPPKKPVIEKPAPGSLEQRVYDLFQYMDEDGSGGVTRNELMAALLSFGLDVSWDYVDRLMSSVDSNGDCEIDVHELTQAFLNEIREGEGEKIKKTISNVTPLVNIEEGKESEASASKSNDAADDVENNETTHNNNDNKTYTTTTDFKSDNEDDNQGDDGHSESKSPVDEKNNQSQSLIHPEQQVEEEQKFVPERRKFPKELEPLPIKHKELLSPPNRDMNLNKVIPLNIDGDEKG